MVHVQSPTLAAPLQLPRLGRLQQGLDDDLLVCPDGVLQQLVGRCVGVLVTTRFLRRILGYQERSLP